MGARARRAHSVWGADETVTGPFRPRAASLAVAVGVLRSLLVLPVLSVGGDWAGYPPDQGVYAARVRALFPSLCAGRVGYVKGVTVLRNDLIAAS